MTTTDNPTPISDSATIDPSRGAGDEPELGFRAADAASVTVSDSRVIHSGSRLRPGFVYLKVGLSSIRISPLKMGRRELRTYLRVQGEVPVFLASFGRAHYWQYCGAIYCDPAGRQQAEVAVAIAELLAEQ